jgi:hypothetical protein
MGKLRKLLKAYGGLAVLRALRDDIGWVLAAPVIPSACAQRLIEETINHCYERWGWEDHEDVPDAHYEITLNNREVDFQSEGKRGEIPLPEVLYEVYYQGGLSDPVRRGITIALYEQNVKLRSINNRYIEFVDGYYEAAVSAYDSVNDKLLGSILK